MPELDRKQMKKMYGGRKPRSDVQQSPLALQKVKTSSTDKNIQITIDGQTITAANPSYVKHLENQFLAMQDEIANLRQNQRYLDARLKDLLNKVDNMTRGRR